MVVRLALVSPLLLLAGCGGYEPDMAQIERELTDGIQEQEQVEVTVDCPDSIEWKPGSDFHCAVDGITLLDPVRVTVSMENDDGDYTWTIG